MEKYDIIIVGAGPGGLTAGIYAGRQGTKTLILDKNMAGGVGREVPEMENYPGFNIISGLELTKKMRSQCEKHVEIHEFEGVNTILEINDKDYNFEIHTEKDKYLTKTVIIATGSDHQHLNVPGETEFKGLGVSYCATCDGLFFQNKDIVMVGGGNSAIQEAVFLRNIGCNVTIVHRREEFRAQQILQDKIGEKGIKTILNSTVKSINGDKVVESVTLENVKTGDITVYPTDAVFISIGYKPHTKIAEELGVKLDETNHIITDKWQKTNKKYVYAAGDVCGGLKQWVVACGEGALASTSAYKDIESC